MSKKQIPIVRTMNHRIAILLLAVISFIFIAVALSTDFPRLAENEFFGDAATYYCMGLSLARDGDLEYTRKDLARVYKEYKRGPQGIFITQSPDSGKLYFGKFFIYPLLCAPFILLFYSQGFYVANAAMLGAMLFAGYYFYHKRSGAASSVIFTVTFFLATTSLLYIYWMGPDFMNLFLVFFGYFLWLFGVRRSPLIPEKVSKFEDLLNSRWSVIFSAFFLSVATYSKPTNVLLILPPILYYLIRKRYDRSVIFAVTFGTVVLMLFGLNFYFTEQFNPYGGERRTFINKYPLEDSQADFMTLGIGTSVTKDVPGVHLDRRIFYNFFYYFFGRFSGMAFYFTPCFYCLLVFLWRPKSLARWLIVGIFFVEMMTFLTLIPQNYFGGGGCVGNRYFLNLAPLFFFIIPPDSLGKARNIFLWLVWAVFLSGMMSHPVYYSFHPAENAKKWPYTWLPVEMTALNDIPINCDVLYRRQPYFGENLIHPDYWLYFLDNNTYLKENDGFWVQGGTSAQFILRTPFPVKEAVFTIKNGRTERPNKIAIRKGFESRKLTLGRNKNETFSFPLDDGFPYGGTHLFHFTISCTEGFVPRFTDPLSYDERFLGCFCQITVVPAEKDGSSGAAHTREE